MGNCCSRSSAPSMDAVESIREMCEKINLVERIDPLVGFIENQLQRMNAPSEAGPSSSDGWLAPVQDATKLACTTLDIISTEAEKLSNSYAVKEMGILMINVMKGVGELHWAFIGLSVAAFALESYISVGSTQNECEELLQKILELAKDIKQFGEQMPDNKEKVCNAVGTIVEGAVMCHGYLKRGKFSRFWSAKSAAGQLEKTNQELRDMQNSLVLSVALRMQKQLTKRLEQSPLQLLDFQPVGIEEQVKEVKALLDMEGRQVALGVIVCGFGGVGKSTLAASVVQSLDWFSTDFKLCRVVIDEKTSDRRSHIIKLQKDIIYDLGGDKLDLRDPHEGRRVIKETLKNKWSLLFIDNVVDKDYIKELLPKDFSSGEEKTKSDADKKETESDAEKGKTNLRKLVAPDADKEERESDAEKQKTKLRILIASRDKNVKAELNMNCKVHEVATLSKRSSQLLLFETIVKGEVTEDKAFDEETMINEVADACRGVPLLLSVFGKHLRTERNKDSYQEALDVLKEGKLDSYRDEDLGKTLMFVYDKITEEDVKEAFLDICKYFHGWEWNLVADIVDFRILQDLRRRMLVSSSSGKVIVHDILRLMGMEKGRLSRFSNLDNLDGLENVKYVKGISALKDNNLITIPSIQLEAMSQSLRVLILGDWVTLEGPPCQKPFTNLRYLLVGDITYFPFKDLSKLDKLRVFINRSRPGMNLSHLPSSIRRVSHELSHMECDQIKHSFENLRCLKSFIVKTQKSVELHENIHLPSSLVDLNIINCKNLPKDISNLTALESIIVDRSDLECLPKGFDRLKSLRHLSMDYCSKLTFLSKEVGMLSSLEVLSMKGCGRLRALPESLGGLVSLQTLEFRECVNLQELPENLGKLHIQSINLHSLVKLHKLPNGFGNMPVLKELRLESCDSLMSLPKSFPQLIMLESLEIINCNKLSVLPEDFGRLRSLNHMTVKECHLLKELPHGFGALQALKTLTVGQCNSFVNLPRDFTELISLEKLHLEYLPLLSRIPDGFGKLKKLRLLYVESCYQLKTLSNDFEYMPNLERLEILNCPELDGAMLEKILKLQNCHSVIIGGSRKLLVKFNQMQGAREHLMMAFSVHCYMTEEEKRRATRVAVVHGKCVEVNNATGQLMERSSLLMGLEAGITVTVALIMLPIHVQSHEHQTLQRVVKIARNRAETNGSGKLQIVCARKVELHAQTPTTTEEEGIRQILLLLPPGSRAIPSSESKLVKILTCCSDPLHDNLNKPSLFIATVHVEGHTSFKNLKFIEEVVIKHNFMETISGEKDVRKAEAPKSFVNLEVIEEEISGNVVRKSPLSEMNKSFDNLEVIVEGNSVNVAMKSPPSEMNNGIQNFIKSICDMDEIVKGADEENQSQAVAGESKTKEFMKALADNGIQYLVHNNTSKVMVDDLHGKTIGFIVCDFRSLECKKLQKIYKDIQQKDSNFIGIWIPIVLPEDCGHGTYSRLIQCMPWATFPDPRLCMPWATFNPDPRLCTYPRFVVLDKYGQIANHDAFPLLLGWGVEAYPFTQRTLPQSFSLMNSESCLEFLLHGMNIVGRKPMKRKMTFMHAENLSEWPRMKCQLGELSQIHGNFEVLFVGDLFEEEIDNIENFKLDYEDATQHMPWPSLSFSDVLTLCFRCSYLANEEVYELNKESSIPMETLHGFAKHFCDHWRGLVLVDNDGPVTCCGYDVVQMICQSSGKIQDEEGMAMRMVKNELMKSMNKGECSPIVKTFFRDEIHNHPQHPQHPIISYSRWEGRFTCDVCGAGFFRGFDDSSRKRSYTCTECEWFMCGSCWMAYAEQEVKNSCMPQITKFPTSDHINYDPRSPTII